MAKTRRTKKKQNRADDKRTKEMAREVAARLLGQPPPPKDRTLIHYGTGNNAGYLAEASSQLVRAFCSRYFTT
jgi:hypothetical protein